LWNLSEHILTNSLLLLPEFEFTQQNTVKSHVCEPLRKVCKYCIYSTYHVERTCSCVTGKFWKRCTTSSGRATQTAGANSTNNSIWNTNNKWNGEVARFAGSAKITYSISIQTSKSSTKLLSIGCCQIRWKVNFLSAKFVATF